MFALSDASQLRELIESAGLVEVVLERVDLYRQNASVEEYIDTQLDLSTLFAEARAGLSREQWNEVKDRIASLIEPFVGGDGAVGLPARALTAAASA